MRKSKIITELKLTFGIKIVGIGRKIFPNLQKTKGKFLTNLKETKSIFFFLHPDAVNKVFKIVLFGLEQIDTNEIINEMQATYNIIPTKIVMFNYVHSPNEWQQSTVRGPFLTFYRR